MPKEAAERSVKTTVLSVDPGEIDWELLRESCCLVSHQLPPKGKNDFHYYARMHNWYKQHCDYPCYLHTYGPLLYVKYPTPGLIAGLEYEKKPLQYSHVDVEDDNVFHAVVKTLVGDYFSKYETFVSNVHFFLRVSSAEEDFVTGLKISVKQNWKTNPNEFLFIDEATRLRRLRQADIDKIENWWNKNYYGLFYVDGQAIFKQLKPGLPTKRQQKQGIYVIHRNQQNKARVTNHSIRSIEELRESRTYLLNVFFERLLQYFSQIGLPFRLKDKTMQRVSIKHGPAMKKRQLPAFEKMVYLVDDRFKPQISPDNFAAGFCAVANSILGDSGPSFAVKEREALEDGDWALRIQDYEAKDFLDDGVLSGKWTDPKSDFYAAYPNVIKQTLNINKNSQRREEEKKRPKATRTSWTSDNYLDYQLPEKKKELADLKMKLDVCRNQLLLKDLVMHRQDARSRLPQIKMMTDKLFLYDSCLAYLDGSTLEFKNIHNNIDDVAALIQEKTGKDLMDDILIPSIRAYYFNPSPDRKKIENSLKRRFIITKEYVWEIVDCDERMLYEDLEIRDRFETLEEAIPTKYFYPKIPAEGSDLFSEKQLQAYADFLTARVKESSISYNRLTKQYGKHIRNEKGKILEKDKGFYALLGITNSTPFKKYLDQELGLKFESLRDQTVIPIQQGIWYEPSTQQYLVSSKDGRQEVQEKGFVFRQIFSRCGKQGEQELFELLKQDFFPMLEVNFIKYNNYTVYPFPFKLIDVWKEMVSGA